MVLGGWVLFASALFVGRLRDLLRNDYDHGWMRWVDVFVVITAPIWVVLLLVQIVRDTRAKRQP